MIKIEVEGKNYIGVPEKEHWDCSGCAFANGNLVCKRIDEVHNGIKLGFDCGENGIIFLEDVVPTYTIDEFFSALIVGYDPMDEPIAMKSLRRLVEERLKVVTDKEYKEFVRLNKKFTGMSYEI